MQVQYIEVHGARDRVMFLVFEAKFRSPELRGSHRTTELDYIEAPPWQKW